jgi:ketosteroid isomerase-like protein
MKERRSPVLLFAGCITVLTLSCAPQQQPAADTRAADEAAIRAADAAWSKTAESKQVDAWVAYYAEDATVLPPNEPMASGTQAIRKTIGDMLAIPGFSIKWQATKVEGARSGDIGYSFGTYEATVNDAKGTPMMDHGKYVTIWKKQPDGSWKSIVDTFNSDLPPAPPPPGK